MHENQFLKICINYHENQKYPDGSLYWPHVFKVGNNLKFLLEHFGEGSDEERINLQLGGYGHDLLEDTNITYEKLQSIVNLKVALLISGMTNEQDDNHTSEYITKIISGGEDIRLIKLSDIYENLLGMYVNLNNDNYLFFSDKIIPIIVPMRFELQSALFVKYPKSGMYLVNEIKMLFKKLKFNIQSIKEINL